MRALLRLRAFVFPLLLLAGLELYIRTAGAQSDALAPPSAGVTALARALVPGTAASLWQATSFTLASAALGLAIAATLGLALGLLLGLSPRAARISFMSIEVFRPVPSVALLPLATLIFGFGLALEVSVVAFAPSGPC